MSSKHIGLFLKVAAIALVGMGVHYYVLSVIMPGAIFLIPIWSIYAFNAIMVAAIIAIVLHYAAKKSEKLFYIFLAYTLLKMLLAVVFLLPLFVQESAYETAEVANFFIPYFGFLVLEVFTLFDFLKKT